MSEHEYILTECMQLHAMSPSDGTDVAKGRAHAAGMRSTS